MRCLIYCLKMNERLIKLKCWETSRGLVEADVPGKTRSNKCKQVKIGKAVLPAGLVGPSSLLPIQIEGVYAKALLDSGSLFYTDPFITSILSTCP